VDEDERRYRAAASKDARFDGVFFIGVTSTGIYCRPSCPAITPKRANMRFYRSAAAAQEAGFRACKRCRPDASPGSPEWNIRADMAARAMRLIADGAVDRAGVTGLAQRLGYSERQVNRAVTAELGAGPLALARAQRAQTARVLTETTRLPLSDIAFAAGFASIRQFNDTVRAVFDMSPTGLRARRSGGPPESSPGTLTVRLPFRRPLCPDNLFGHLAATAVPGVEEVVGATYRRTLHLAHGAGIVALTPMPEHIACRVDLADVADLTAAIARCRRLLDLDADPEAVDRVLAGDPALAPLVAAAPGRRVPRTVDGAEFAVRAVLGQQVSTAGARTTTAALVAAHGDPVEDPSGGLTRLFPTPTQLVDAAPALPGARRRTLAVLVEALVAGRLDLGPGADRVEARRVLATLPGVGPWTVEMVAMRSLGDPDAFPGGDLGVRRGADALGLPALPGPLGTRSERWRPWRAYAVQHLWSATDHPVNHWPPPSRSGHRPATARRAETAQKELTHA
jgi:AraC family transcriptional regulator, regulatory protein of adaptative response / DNA-3-methyladenine glycosylase II